MQTDEISHLLSRDPLMCRTYDVVAKDSLPDIIVDTYPTAIVCNTHDSDRPGEHWVALYVDTERRGDYFVRIAAAARRIRRLYDRTLLHVVD